MARQQVVLNVCVNNWLIAAPERSFFVVFALYLYLSILPTPVFGISYPPEISLLSPSEVAVAPRQMLSSSLKLKNRSDITTTFVVSAETPPGWNFSVFPAMATIDPGDSELVFVTINIPQNTAAGDYLIKLISYPIDMPSESVSLDLNITILEFSKLEIFTTRHSPTTATTGDIITQTFTVANLGNKRTNINIEVDSYPDWPFIVDPPGLALDLDSGKTGQITVDITVPDEISQSITYRLSIMAYSGDPTLPDSLVQANTSTIVIPTHLSGSMYSSLDGDVTIITTLNDNNDPAYLASIGPLRSDLGEGRTLKLEMHNLLMDGDPTGSFVHRERIWGSYEDDDNGYMRLGDLSMNLESPLIERNFTGRVGDALIDLDPLGFRFFRSRTRGSSPEKIYGLQLILADDDAFNLRLTGIKRSEDNYAQGDSNGSLSSTNIGLSLGFMPFGNTWITGEIGQTKSAVPGSDNAFRVTGRHTNNWLSADFEWLKAGAGYLGGWTDTEVQRMGVHISPTNNLDVWGNYYQTDNNLKNDPGLESHNFTNSSAGMTWQIDDIGRLSYSQREIKDWENVNSSTDRLTHSSRYSFSRTWDNFNLTASYDQETSDDRITGVHLKTTTPRLDLAVLFGQDASFRLSYSFGTQSRPDLMESMRINNLSLSSQVRLSSDLDFYSNFQSNSGGTEGRRTNIFGYLSWDLSDNRNLKFQFRNYDSSQGDNTEFTCQYTLPVSIPTGIATNRGGLEGRVYLENNPEPGIENVILKLGNTAVVTDNHGNFSFPSLEPGLYHLTLDSESLGIGLLPALPVPILCEIAGSETVQIDIPVIETVSVQGHVLYIPTPAFGDTEVSMPLAEMLIELRNENGSDFRFTNSSGEFLFFDILPGTYEIILKSQYIPDNYQVLNSDTYLIDLNSNDSLEDIVFVLVPIKKELIIKSASAFVAQ